MAKERVIPINHAEGQAVAGEIIKTRNLIEGIILGGIPFVAVLYFCRSLTFADKVTIAIIVALPMLYLGINGINGDSFTTFISIWLRYRRKRRVVLYNPRIKTEATPLIFETKKKEELLPKEKLLLIYEKIRARRKAIRVTKNNVNVMQTEEGFVFFEDDIGILAKPEEYKTSKELKRERRKVKRKNNQITDRKQNGKTTK